MTLLNTFKKKDVHKDYNSSFVDRKIFQITPTPSKEKL